MAWRPYRSGDGALPVRRRPGWRGWILRLLLLILLLPLGLVLVYRILPVPMTPLMLLRLGQGEGLAKDWVGYDRLSPNLRRAAIASEDATFCGNDGFDFGAIRQAWRENQAGRRTRGGSTITQQTAKNLFLWPGGGWPRKIAETYPAILIGLLWPKSRVLTVYLNIIEFGPGLYGAEAAAQHYFHHPAAELSEYQAALLVAVLPNPRRWSPLRPTPFVREHAATITARMHQVPADCP